MGIRRRRFLMTPGTFPYGGLLARASSSVLFETPSGRRALPSSRFSATSLVFSDISLVVVREEEPPPQLVAEMMFLPGVSQVPAKCFPGFT